MIRDHLAARLKLIRRQFGSRQAEKVPLGLDEYQRFAVRVNTTGLRGKEALTFLLLGLFGEVGSLLSEIKKKQRDRNAYFAFAETAREELGDVLWYFSNIAEVCGCRLSVIANRASQPTGAWIKQPRSGRPNTFFDLQRRDYRFLIPNAGPMAERYLLRLASAVGQMLSRPAAGNLDNFFEAHLVEIFRALRIAADSARLGLDDAAVFNLEKAIGRFPIKRNWGDIFDANFDVDERFPSRLTLTVKEKRSGGGGTYVLLEVNGVHIGDRLTDNSAAEDGYRYHDVFHLSYATYLGWSPVLRALLKLKRKSNPRVDEQQDGARAIITEEGISNWIFAHGARHRFFEDVSSLDFALLKTIREMVKGYEVESRPLWIWEEAILSGFKMFRLLKRNGGGVVIADLRKHSLSYRPPR